jgi:toxin-antitoxin system PIN domain toxin
LLLVDTNVLVYAHRADTLDHGAWRSWLEQRANGVEPWAVTVGVIAGFLRIVTSHRVFPTPTPLGEALRFVDALRASQSVVVLGAGPRTVPTFLDLVRSTDARGKHIPDAELAALALEHGCELASADRDFCRYPGLRYRHPLRG